ncbi:hypothetical protein J0895_23640, partial [Phormidium pseudopriestleyi FRX01]
MLALNDSEQDARTPKMNPILDTPTLFRAWDSLRVQNLNLKGVVKAPLLTPLRLNPSVAATFLKIFA